MKRLNARSLLALLFLLPMTLAVVYWLFVASDLYESSASVVIQKSTGDVGAGSQLASLIGVRGSSMQDALVVKEHILSHDMLEKADEALGLRAHYTAKNADPFSRFSAAGSKEQFYEYFLKRLTVTYDEQSTIIDIKARAFDPEMAKSLVSFLIQESERYINQVSQKLALGQVEFASLELAKSRKRLGEASENVLAFQNKHGLVSPEGETRQISSIVSALESELAEKNARLKTLGTYLNPSASDIRLLRAQINALKDQIEKEREKITGASGEPLNQLSVAFQSLYSDLEFSKDSYGATLTALEAARLEAGHKLKYLVVVESPVEPDEARYPRRLYNLVTFSVVLLLLYWITQLGIATVKDHMD
ncbi:MAG: hypothetical protein ACWA44_04370 [Thiotrichales bacterium]